MKFAKLPLGLLAAALLTVAPSSAFAGKGLLDRGCGCATQKGGHIVQKGPVIQKGHVVQKGGIAQKGCGIAQKGCGSSKGGGCGKCSICLPRILPALVHGIDSVLNTIFCCNSCGATKGGCGCATQKGHIAQKAPIVQKGHVFQKGHAVQKGGSCGCSGDAPPYKPSDPFIDDLQPPPVMPDAEADARVRVRRPAAQPIRRTVAPSTRSVVRTSATTSREPRAFPAELVSPIDKVRQARESQPTPAAVIRTSATTPAGIVVPANPLR